MRATLALAALAVVLLTACETSGPRVPNSRPAGHAQQPVIRVAPSAWRAEANRWLGAKYRKGGMDRSGIDCSGLTIQMYRQVAGVALPRTTQDQSRSGVGVSLKDLRPGDLVFFKTLKYQSVDHVGVYLGDMQFVHASASKGVVISSLQQDYYVRRYHSARRILL